MNPVKTLTIALLIGTAAVTASPLSAATVSVVQQTESMFRGAAGLGGSLGSLSVKYSMAGDRGKTSARAGGLQMMTDHDVDGNSRVGTGAPGAMERFIAFCVNPFTRLDTAFSRFDAYSDISDPIPSLSTQQLRALGGLARGAWAKITDTTSAAAFQLAVWEIVSETGDSLNLSDGAFRLAYPGILEPAPETHAAAALANLWLASLGTAEFKPGTKGLTIFHSDDTVRKGRGYTKATQDLMTYTPPAPVPLPGAFGFLAIGLAALVAKGRARRMA